MRAQFIRGEDPKEVLEIGIERLKSPDNFRDSDHWAEEIVKRLPQILGIDEIPHDIIEERTNFIAYEWRVILSEFFGDSYWKYPLAAISRILIEKGYSPEGGGPEIRP